MKVNEYGSEHEKTVAMFQCAAEPGWVFIPSAEALARISCGTHEELLESSEKYSSFIKRREEAASTRTNIHRRKRSRRLPMRQAPGSLYQLFFSSNHDDFRIELV